MTSKQSKLEFDIPVLTELEARSYLEQQEVLQYLGSAKRASEQIPQDLRDLARLHWLAASRKVFTVLEFGVGWSTLVLAAAVRTNRLAWDALVNSPKLQNQISFSVHSVDASKRWIENTHRLLPKELVEYVSLSHSGVAAGTFNGHMCHFYDQLPDVVPDLIYLDGPNPADVNGEVNGLSWKNSDRPVLSGDLLTIESTLLPGTFVLVDGRTNNARFLLNNLQRPWGVVHDVLGDFTAMELQEPSLGSVNNETLQYCLGQEYFRRVNLNDA